VANKVQIAQKGQNEKPFVFGLLFMHMSWKYCLYVQYVAFCLTVVKFCAVLKFIFISVFSPYERKWVRLD